MLHTPEPGDSHVPQLLHARCLIVLFCIFSCPVPLPPLLTVGKHTTIRLWFCPQHPLPPPPFPPSRLPLDSVPRPLLTRSPSHQSGSLRKKLWSDSQSHNNAKRAATFFRITLGVWLTPVQIQYDGQKNKNETVFKSKSSPGRETPPDITHTHSLAKFCILVLYYSWSHCLLQLVFPAAVLVGGFHKAYCSLRRPDQRHVSQRRPSTTWQRLSSTCSWGRS